MTIKSEDIVLRTPNGFFFLSRSVSDEERRLLSKAGAGHKVVGVPNAKVLEFWRSGAKVKALFGGNRAGKTESATIEVAWYLLADHPFRDLKAPTRVRYLIPDYSMIEGVVKPKLLRYLSPAYLYGGSWEKAYSKRFHQLRLQNGSLLDFKTHLTPLLGLEGVSLHLVVIDEECDYEAYKSLLVRTMDTNGQVIITATPLKGLTWMWTEIKEKADGELIFVAHLTTEENRFLDEQGVQKVATLIDDPARFQGEFFDQRVFPYCTEALLIDEPIAGGTYYVGFDFGVNCPAVVVVVRLTDDGRVIVEDHKEWRNTGLSEVLDEAIVWLREQGFTNAGDLPIFIYDSALNGRDTTGYPPAWKFGEKGIASLPSTKKVSESIGVLNSLMRAHRLLFYDRTLHRAMRGMAYKHGKELPKKGDDAVDALRYAVYHLYATGLLHLNDETPALSPATVEDDDDFPSASAIITERIRQRREAKQAQVGYGRWNFFSGEVRL
jgi:phage terminase large subunit-like protein